ncbi:aminotransferase class V-fold PLP-dependent enzyme [Curtobacterium flaccumfaciens pv. flaccumfaciens]|uniref:aminotransferase class V-fold PLP-dependent enzyme n=1 Tax=Curtobacterium flaccumfaciens TaxID=2035 RepID=UPI002657EF96|nr:aminotransferase class V-fold PLP-dependent enzyme [Curtobacterium flaccumfaciens]MCS5509370.1 aminotransferase class V-fold PLP-dependent enzyme [Curtobacterium flaccumfaciens pv. flaccumfaciens]MCX2785772.1 aminotransferase class V-fold PLP-dependent enzyme [Curtobacterium flaccumfaciens pv. flaccumfaciens]
MIYLDSAATSFPKADEVAENIANYVRAGTSPGRSGHRLARWAEERVDAARAQVAQLFSVSDRDRVIFGLNATMELNAVAHHLARQGGTVLTSAFEHNSVSRPLHALDRDGALKHEVIPRTATEPVDLDWLDARLQHGDVTGVIMTWSSNVTGTVLPIASAAELCRANGVLIVADAAQAAGYIPIDASTVDILVFAGHKGLGGPQGVGGAVIGEGVHLEPFIRGGSGGRSESPDQPRWLPWSHESGTVNGPGLAGLAAALKDVTPATVVQRRQRLSDLRAQLVKGLGGLRGVHVIDPPSAEPATAVVSFMVDNAPVSAIGEKLEERWDILVRTGLHCAPMAHQAIGTLTTGTVRMSLGAQTTAAEVETAVGAIETLRNEYQEAAAA